MVKEECEKSGDERSGLTDYGAIIYFGQSSDPLALTLNKRTMTNVLSKPCGKAENQAQQRKLLMVPPIPLIPKEKAKKEKPDDEDS